MHRFARLYLDLDATTSTKEKADLLAAYLQAADPRDGAWVVAIISGERPKGAASTAVLRELAAEVTGLPPWLVAECHGAVGDYAETVALLLPDRDQSAMAETSSPALYDVIERFVLPLRHSDAEERKRILREAWAHFDADERFVYHKLIRGGFRIGVAAGMLARALANLTGLDHAVMAHRLSGTVRPTPEFYQALIDHTAANDPDAAKPYPFFLAHPLEAAPESLGPVTDWIAEWKWDGTRAQLIRRNEETVLWSRGEAIITAQFPEIIAAANDLPDGTVLDGEVLLWSSCPGEGSEQGRPKPFSELQTRLNRTVAPTQQMSLFDRDEAVFVAYDLLEHAGQDIRALPQHERRARMHTLLQPIPLGVIRISTPLDAASWDDLAQLRAQAVGRGAEGLMLKHIDAPYRVGRTKGDDPTPGWLKWKVDPCSVDAVMVAAQLGSGRRASLYTDYTFAVWTADEAADHRELITFAKAYSGLTNDEIERVDAWVRDHTTLRRGPVRLVKPELVFEIGFEGIRRSPRHKSGIAVRFPRMLRWRHDKPAAQADTLARLEALLAERAW
jgi:DNA ligase-1